MSVKVVSVSGNTLTAQDGSGNQLTHAIAPGATVTLNGAASSLDKLRAGDSVALSGNPATSVVATR